MKINEIGYISSTCVYHKIVDSAPDVLACLTVRDCIGDADAG